jgi:hypothetical protein
MNVAFLPALSNEAAIFSVASLFSVSPQALEGG